MIFLWAVTLYGDNKFPKKITGNLLLKSGILKLPTVRNILSADLIFSQPFW